MMTTLASAFDFISNRRIPLEFLPSPSIDVAKTICQATANPMWMDKVIAYLKDGKLPTDKLHARRVQYRLARFCIIQETLYKRSFSGPLLRYLQHEKADYVLKEIHECIYKNHSRARSLIKKVVCQGYFWP